MTRCHNPNKLNRDNSRNRKCNNNNKKDLQLERNKVMLRDRL
jgi:hypothetical protein